jgi:hypothetical protein
MRYISLFLILISLNSCLTPEKKLQKLLRKYPELVRKDTIVLRDTITFAPYHLDTVIQNVIGDTVIIQDSLTKIVYYNDGKTVYLKGECKERDVILEREVPIDRIINVVREEKPWYVKYLWWWAILSAGFIVGRIGWNVVLRYLNVK